MALTFHWFLPTNGGDGRHVVGGGHGLDPGAAGRSASVSYLGQIARAAEDLGFEPSIPRSSWHPGNVWSLHGYHECLVRLGKPEPAAIVKQQLDVALARADVPIKSSCFCRMTQHAAVAELS